MLYTPARFVETDADVIREAIAASPFGMLISVVDGQPVVTHVPAVFDESAGRDWLLSHVACANPHSAALGRWRRSAGGLQRAARSYIADLVRRSVRADLELRRSACPLPGSCPDRRRSTSAARYADGNIRRHDTARPPESRGTRPLLKMIHCFRLEPLQIDAKFKLSQNKPKVDQQKIIAKLSQQEDENAQAVASLMLRNLAGNSLI